jgi:hypothetical protein
VLRIKELRILNLEDVTESQTDSSGFPTFCRLGGEGLGWGDGSVPDGVSGWVLCRLAGEMGSFGKKRIGGGLGGPRVGPGGESGFAAGCGSFG